MLPSGPPIRRLARHRSVRALSARGRAEEEEPQMILSRKLSIALSGIAIVAVACGGSTGATTAPTAAATTAASAEATTAAATAAPAAVKVQLQWVPQAQFAGEIAAREEGYYAAENLTVTLVDGGPNVANITVGCAPDGPEFTLGWVPKALVAVESGNCDLVSIAQIFQRSGTRSVSWK